jgi:hypothetical protein
MALLVTRARTFYMTDPCADFLAPLKLQGLGQITLVSEGTLILPNSPMPLFGRVRTEVRCGS